MVLVAGFTHASERHGEVTVGTDVSFSRVRDGGRGLRVTDDGGVGDSELGLDRCTSSERLTPQLGEL